MDEPSWPRACSRSSFVAGASAKKPPPPPLPPPPPPSDQSPTAPTNLRLTVNGLHSITVAWDASNTSSSNWWYRIQRDGQAASGSTRPRRRSRSTPGTTFNYSVVAITSTGETLGQQQQRHLHHAGRHDGLERADAIADRQLAGSHLRRLDGVGRRRRQPGLVHSS